MFVHSRDLCRSAYPTAQITQIAPSWKKPAGAARQSSTSVRAYLTHRAPTLDKSSTQFSKSFNSQFVSRSTVPRKQRAITGAGQLIPIPGWSVNAIVQDRTMGAEYHSRLSRLPHFLYTQTIRSARRPFHLRTDETNASVCQTLTNRRKTLTFPWITSTPQWADFHQNMFEE